MRIPLKVIRFLLLASLLGVSCTPRASLGPVYIFSEKDLPIDIEVGIFYFSPNHFVILHNLSHVTLCLRNTSETWHNFTLTDQENRVIASKDLNPHESLTIRLDSLTSSNYFFYCNRFLHRSQGMKGMLMID